LDRTSIAYLLILFLALAVGSILAYRWRNSRTRVYQRRQAREHKAHAARMAEGAATRESES
jgi:hypothetical protein